MTVLGCVKLTNDVRSIGLQTKIHSFCFRFSLGSSSGGVESTNRKSVCLSVFTSRFQIWHGHGQVGHGCGGHKDKDKDKDKYNVDMNMDVMDMDMVDMDIMDINMVEKLHLKGRQPMQCCEAKNR